MSLRRKLHWSSPRGSGSIERAGGGRFLIWLEAGSWVILDAMTQRRAEGTKSQVRRLALRWAGE